MLGQRFFEPAVFDQSFKLVVAVELRWVEGEQVGAAVVVALHALGAAGVAPGEFAFAEVEHAVAAFIGCEPGIGLGVVPNIIVGVPFVVVPMEHLSFEPLGFALDGKGHRLGNHATVRKAEMVFEIATVWIVALK